MSVAGSVPARAPYHGRARTGRITALDAARALAVVGMIAVNVGPRTSGGFADVLYRLPLGRASLLFVVLAGVGVTFLARRTSHGKTPAPWATLLWRAGLLLAGGLALQLLDHGVSVILPTYAFLFALSPVFLRATDRLIVISAAGSMVLGPVVWITAQVAQGEIYGSDSPVLTDSPASILHGVFLSGSYPVFTWLGPFLLGMWLGRQRLQSRSFQVRMIVVGVVATFAGRAISLVLIAWIGEPASAVGFDRLVTSVGHSQMPLWLLSGTGSAVLILGALLRTGSLVDRWLWPLVYTGQLALTVYVAHLLVLALLVRPEPHRLSEGVLISIAMSGAAVILAAAWRRRFTWGPLEGLLRPPWAAR